VATEEVHISLPRQPWPASAAIEPLPPDPADSPIELAYAQEVRWSSVLLVVQRIWPRPNRSDSNAIDTRASNDPDVEAQAADIIALYLDPRQHAAVFCVDEKTAIQALDRLDPVLLPLSPGRAERHGFEYYRQGTLS
jgi:hypothetical protein